MEGWDDAPDCGMAEKQYSANNQSGPETPVYSCLFPVQPSNFLIINCRATIMENII